MTEILVGLACLILGGWFGIALERFHAPIRAFRERSWRARLYKNEICALSSFIRGGHDP